MGKTSGVVGLVAVVVLAVGCGTGAASTNEDGTPEAGGQAGSAGAAGQGGSAGKGGSGGQSGASQGGGSAGEGGSAAGAGGEQAGGQAGEGQGGSGAGGQAGAAGAEAAGASGATGQPIEAPKEAWTWVPVEGSECANGSPTGFGVNLTDKSKDVLIFLEGGGACWDGTTCWGPVQTAFNASTGYGELQLKTDPQIAAIYLLNRLDPTNPFRDKNIVYIPYCSGDSFAGDTVTTFNYLGVDHPTHFKGYRNVGLFLERIVPTFTDAKRVWLAGDSAGGFGAAFNFGRVQEAFGPTRVDVLDDSGQPVMPDPAQWEKWKNAWNIQFPADCADCSKGPPAFVDYYKKKYPTSRFGLISFEYDTVIAPFMNLTLAKFHDELFATAASLKDSWPNGHYYILQGASHVGLVTPTPSLKNWVNAMVTDDPAWTNNQP